MPKRSRSAGASRHWSGARPAPITGASKWRTRCRPWRRGSRSSDALLDATNVAEQAYTDATNRAAVLYNSGDEAGSVAVFQTDGQVTLDELGRQVAATDTALESVRVAVLHLQEVVR